MILENSSKVANCDHIPERNPLRSQSATSKRKGGESLRSQFVTSNKEKDNLTPQIVISRLKMRRYGNTSHSKEDF